MMRIPSLSCLIGSFVLFALVHPAPLFAQSSAERARLDEIAREAARKFASARAETVEEQPRATVEPLPGFLARRARVLPPAAEVVAAAPSGAVRA